MVSWNGETNNRIIEAAEDQGDGKVAYSDFVHKTWQYNTFDIEKQEVIKPLIRMVSPTYICVRHT